ncbi:MAG: polyphenol oxidase family protein, partial [Thermoanaerobaculia bacterium]|nr:polyphenol oxidase family protein [Thermoanaerobaculia bacterium]
MTDSPERHTDRTGTDRRPTWEWTELTDGVEIRFLGRAAAEVEPGELAQLLDPPPDAVSRLVQVHSDRVVEATPGVAGEGDALVSRASDLALAVATADCVPVLLAGPDAIAAIHAGWRGLVADVIARTLERLPNAGRLSAWIGPAIGACCYEVSSEVAERVAAASTSEI